MKPLLQNLISSRILGHILLLMLYVIIMSPVGAEAQTTGKIAGAVVEASTGEPVIGANAYFEGIALGAATDVDGFYTILNVPPGTYELIVEAIGFRKVVVTEVKVRVNYTTTINVSMESEVLEGETVVVIAERPLVEKDQTGARQVVTSEEIDILPVTSFDQVVELQAGVVNGRFRGGRANEVLYMIDGVPVNSAATGGRGATVGIEAVENLEVISGTFNAEYGRVMSGVVNAITKSGSKEYRGNLELYSGDYFSTDKIQGHEIYPSNSSFGLDGIADVRGSFEGPVPFTNDKLTFVLSGGASFNDGYLTGHGRNLFLPTTIHDPALAEQGIFNVTGDKEEYTTNSWGGGDLLAKLNYPLTDFTTLSLSFLYNQSEWKDYTGFWRFAPEGRTKNIGKSINNIFTVRHVFNQEAFATFNVAFLDESYESYVEEDPLSDRYLPGEYRQEGLINGTGLAIGGTDLFNFKRGSKTITAKGDVTWQLHRQHEIKAGFEYSDYNMDEDYITILFANEAAFQSDMTAGIVDKWRFRSINNSLVDVDYQYYHNDLAGDRNPYERDASQGAVYLQDKMEFDKVVVNAGLRVDYFDPEFGIPKDLTDPNGDIAFPGLSREEQLDRSLEDADVQVQLSPRIGLAYQATTTGIVHFSYGHFFQIPPLENLYSNPNFRILPGVISSSIMGNAGLKAQQTVSYELAYSDILSEGIVGEISVFYRDIYDLLGTEILETLSGQPYARWTNVDYGNVKGAVISAEVRSGSFTSTLDYTYQIAEGNASDPASAFLRAQGGEKPNLEAVRLNWDQRHTIVGTFNYVTPDYGLSLIGRYGSGNPFQYSPLPAPGKPTLTLTQNNGQMPPNFNIDLNANYNIGEYYGVKMKAYFQAYNILDIRNPNYVFGDSGSPKSTANVERNRTQLERATFTTPEKLQYDGTSFVSPRQIRLGLGFLF